MTNSTPHNDNPFDDATLAELNELLADPIVWDLPATGSDADFPADFDDVPDPMEDAIVAAIMAEAASHTSASTSESEPPVSVSEPPASVSESEAPASVSGDRPAQPTLAQPIDLAERRNRASRSQSSRWNRSLAVAGAAALVVGAFTLGRISIDADNTDSGVEIAAPDHQLELAGTDLAPNASALAAVTITDRGTKIVLDVSDLPPAPPGSYYEAWLRKDAEIGVSAGTFHLRGGDEPLELWAGVPIDDFPLLTVTIQDEAQPMSSGRVVLKASLP